MCFLSSSPIFPGLRASSGARMGQTARDKRSDTPSGQPLPAGPAKLRCTFANREGEGLGKCIYAERKGKHIGKYARKKEGVPLGNPLEKGTKIIPCMPRIQTSLVEVRGILVWELGHTCEAARNGTQIGPGPLLKLPLNQQKIPKGPQEIPQNKSFPKSLRIFNSKLAHQSIKSNHNSITIRRKRNRL